MLPHNGLVKPPHVNPSNINFKLRQLALLSALAETGTLRAAADRISVSQPGATRLLHELESMLGVKLFERVKGRMVVTAAGETMTAHANSLQSEMLLAYTETIESAKGNAGHVRLGIFSSLDPDLLSQSLLTVRKKLPLVRVSVTEAPQELLTSALRRFEIDAAVGRLLSMAGAEDLRYDVLYRESFCVVCGPKNPLARGGRAGEIARLLDARWILAPLDSALGQQIDGYFMTHFGKVPRGTIVTRSLLAHLALLASTEDVSVLPSGVARFLERSGQVCILAPQFGNIEGIVTFITRAHAPLRPSVDLLRSAMQDNGRR